MRGTRRRLRQSGSLRLVLLWASALLVCGGCSIDAPVYRSPAGGQQAEVAVRTFRVSAAAGEYSGATDFGALFAEYLSGALQERGVRAVVVPLATGTPRGVTRVIEGEITQIDPGNWNLRLWIGFGAGAAAFGAKVRVQDVRGNQPVYSQTLSVHAVTLQGSESILRRCAAGLAKRFAGQIESQEPAAAR